MTPLFKCMSFSLIFKIKFFLGGGCPFGIVTDPELMTRYNTEYHVIFISLSLHNSVQPCTKGPYHTTLPRIIGLGMAFPSLNTEFQVCCEV